MCMLTIGTKFCRRISYTTPLFSSHDLSGIFGCFSNSRTRRNQHIGQCRWKNIPLNTSCYITQCPSMNQTSWHWVRLFHIYETKSNLSGNVATCLFRIAYWNDALLQLIFKRWQPVKWLVFFSFACQLKSSK